MDVKIIRPNCRREGGWREGGGSGGREGRGIEGGGRGEGGRREGGWRDRGRDMVRYLSCDGCGYYSTVGVAYPLQFSEMRRFRC